MGGPVKSIIPVPVTARSYTRGYQAQVPKSGVQQAVSQSLSPSRALRNWTANGNRDRL